MSDTPVNVRDVLADMFHDELLSYYDMRPSSYGKAEALIADLSAAGVTVIPASDYQALVEALRRLSFCAQTTGGTAGRDDDLCAAIDAARNALAKVEKQG